MIVLRMISGISEVVSALSPPLVVPRQPSPTTPLRIVELRYHVEPAALLAEALLEAENHHLGRLGVKLANLVPAVVVLGVRQRHLTALHLAAWDWRKK